MSQNWRTSTFRPYVVAATSFIAAVWAVVVERSFAGVAVAAVQGVRRTVQVPAFAAVLAGEVARIYFLVEACYAEEASRNSY